MFPTANIRSLACALEAALCLFLLYTRKVWIEEKADCTSTPKVQGGVGGGGMCQRDVTHS